MRLVAPLPVPPSTVREFDAAQGREELRRWLCELRESEDQSVC